MERRVVRTARVAVRATLAQRRRCFGLLFAAGDVWAGLIDLNRARFARGGPPVFGFAALCRELTGADLGPLARICAEDVAKRYSAACFETARRKQAGGRARYPRRKRAVVPVRFRWSAFTLDGRRLRLAVAKGQPELWVRLTRDIPYDLASVRAVTLVADAGRLYVDVSAEVLVEDHDGHRLGGRPPGRDLGGRGPQGNHPPQGGAAPEPPGQYHLAAYPSHRGAHRQSHPGRDHRGPRRRTGHLLHLPPLPPAGPQTTRPGLHLPYLRTARSPRRDRRRQHRRPRRRNHRRRPRRTVDHAPPSRHRADPT